MLGHVAQFRDACIYHSNSTLQVPNLAGLTGGSALWPQVRLLSVFALGLPDMGQNLVNAAYLLAVQT